MYLGKQLYMYKHKINTQMTLNQEVHQTHILWKFKPRGGCDKIMITFHFIKEVLSTCRPLVTGKEERTH